MGKSLLDNCNACGKEVSRHSPFCRHCGHPQKLPLVIWLLVLFLLLMIAFYMAFVIYGIFHVQDFRASEKLTPGADLSLLQRITVPDAHKETLIPMGREANG